jgi:uncharacterized DUF497 family protein
MDIEFDPVKRAITLAERGLDLAEVWRVFAGPVLTFDDHRFDYGEDRKITIGYLYDRMVLFAWTKRGEKIRVISLRKTNDRERRIYGKRLAGS